MTGETTIQDLRPAAQVAAAETYIRAKELRLQADSAVTAANKAMPRQAFDAGILGPQDQHWEFRHLQWLGAEDAFAWVERSNGAYGRSGKRQKYTSRATRDVLEWLLRFPGETWDERWFASGLDQAPRTGRTELSARLARPMREISLGMTSIVRARLVRPSYEWMFSSKQWNNSRGAVTFLDAAEPEETPRMRILPQSLAAAHMETYTVEGVTYGRHDPPVRTKANTRARIWAEVIAADEDATPPVSVGKRADITAFEADCFWGWAVAATLKETGVRIEELLELTQLSLRHYVAPTTNTIVPLLHIVPSKNDQERLIPMSPELVKILVEVQRRARGTGQAVPLSTRYDPNDKTFSEPLPHLFARLVGPTQNVLSYHYVRKLLIGIASHAGLSDGGIPVTFTPHDFRRLFATELVGSGLPLHIVSTLLGHLNLETTRGYTAVFPEHVIQAHHAFIERRRHTRPSHELRPASSEEWQEFEQHFLLRRVALGTCHRPYATPCVHEHACIKCRFLQVDPAETGRIEDMTANAEARLDEARQHQWLGEVKALEESLVHLRRRRHEVQASPSPARVSDVQS